MFHGGVWTGLALGCLFSTGNLAVTTRKMGGICHVGKWVSNKAARARYTLLENADLASNHMFTASFGYGCFPMVTETQTDT
jgi:hypothetical protein